MKEQNNKTRWLHLRLSEDEYQQIHKQFSKTLCNKLSEYARKILLGKPIVSTYRNQSLDDFMSEMIQFRTELNAIGNNFNQAVKRLHTLNNPGQIQQWISVYELDKNRIQNSVQNIEDAISKMADKWLQ